MALLRDKVALITGGAGVLGKAFAEKFLSLGCKVCVCDVNASKGEEVQQDLESQFGCDSVHFLQCDVTSDTSFKGAFTNCKEKFGKVDILINNAGIGDEKDFKRNMEINLGGTIRGTELAVEQMSKAKGHGGGMVVNIASIAGLKVIPFGPFYAASKSAIIHYTRSAGHPFHMSYSGVVIQCLCPSLVESPFIHIPEERSYNAQSAVAVKGLFKTIQTLEPEEVAAALVTLMEENKPGAVMVVEKAKSPYYVDSPL